MLLLFLAGSTVGKGSFARARSWAPRRREGTGQGCPWGCGSRGRSTSGAGRRGSGCRRCCGSGDGVEIARLLPFSDSPVVRQLSLWPSLPWRPGNHTTPMQDTVIIEDSFRLLMREEGGTEDSRIPHNLSSPTCLEQTGEKRVPQDTLYFWIKSPLRKNDGVEE